MKRIFVLLIVFTATQTVFSWNNHTEITNLILTQWINSTPSIQPNLNQHIQTESLRHFLETTKNTLPKKLNEIEKISRATQEGYSPLPDSLRYDPTQSECKKDLVVCFKKSLRINLQTPLPNLVYDSSNWYLQHIPSAKKVLKANEIMLPVEPGELYKKFTLLPFGASIRKADIIITSSIQPDFGLDMHLYSDSDTAFGKEYQFGTQPFGAPTEFNSQILFHMSTYQDHPLLKNYLPRLKEDYLEYRAILYFKLAQFAAEENHPYWSAVFLGWGLHYIQDLTQPYHTVLTNGIDESSLKEAIQALEKGDFKLVQNLITLQTNRHILLENLTDYLLTSSDNSLSTYRAVLSEALADTSLDSTLTTCEVEPGYIRNNINAKLAVEAPFYSSMLRNTLPASLVDNPNFRADEFNNYPNLFNQDMNANQRSEFTRQIAKAFTWLGAYTRHCLR